MMKKVFGLAAAAALAVPLFVSAGPSAQDHTDSPPVAAQDHADEKSDLSFIYPLALLGLGTLPAIWWLSRVSPPPPKVYDYPPVALLGGLKPTEETPAKTPLWQFLLRIGAAGAFVLAMAQPVLDLPETFEMKGPLVLVIDNDWAAASRWQVRREEMNRWIDRAAREGRQILVLPTTQSIDGAPSSTATILDADEARKLVESLMPQPWPSDRAAAGEALVAASLSNANVVWLSNGIDGADGAAFAQTLKNAGSLKIVEDTPDHLPFLLAPSEPEDEALAVTLQRPVGGPEQAVTIVAKGEDGRIIERMETRFEKGMKSARAVFNIPAEIRNQISQITIEGENSAGAVVLLDEQWARRPVGIADAKNSAADQLLDETHYVRQALAPYADIRYAPLDKILKEDMAVLVLTDSARVTAEDAARLETWVQAGGTLLRFAGPHIANGEAQDHLFPVELRTGAHETGGSILSWRTPAKIGSFSKKSPLKSLSIPEDVEIKQQILAEPGIDLSERTWASLTDGTPLVTAEKRGAGTIILVHTSADPRWSNLPLSELFVDMLKIVVTHSHNVGAQKTSLESAPLLPWKTLDGFGKLGDPSIGAKALSPENAQNGIANPENPPGFYGSEGAAKAYNLAASVHEFIPLSGLPKDAVKQGYAQRGNYNLTGAFLGGATALLIADLLIVLGQRGLIPVPGRGKKSSTEQKNAKKPVF